MTRIINGVAQPDIVARKEGQVRYIFVETPESLKANEKPLLEAWHSILQKEPTAKIEVVRTD